jgi:hypothetical protein
VSAAGGGSAALTEPDLPPPQALRRPVVIIRTMARNEFRMESNGRECRVIGFMGLEIPISIHSISRGIFLY